MDRDLSIVSLALTAFLVALLIDVSVAPRVEWGFQTVIYWIALYCSWLIALPVYMASRWPLRDVSKLFAYSLVLWSVEDPLYYYILGYSAFSPFPENPGMYPLMIYWWPVWFMVLGRLFTGLVILVYLTVNPEWGEDAISISLTSEETRWILKVAAIIIIAGVTSWAWYQQYSRAGFGGDVLYEIELSYKREESTEMIYRGVLARMKIETPLPVSGVRSSTRYVLLRPHPDINPLPLARITGSRIINSYMGKEVEILGKMVWRDYRRELLPGRIREAAGNGD